MYDSGQSMQIPPVYTELKDLYLTTELVKQSGPNATIVTAGSGIYDEEASQIQEVIEKLSGVKVPIATDDSPAGAVPITGNLIVLGNRSTNKTIEELYNRYHTLLDLRYPGPEGYEVRSLHNPFGEGYNVIFAGGSDGAGVASATEVLREKLTQAEAGDGTLSVGWLMEIQLGKGIEAPEDVGEFEIWEASAGSGSRGYFGWNSISKRMAMYYMTGDEFHAREFIRLAFPDARAMEEVAEADDERIENKDEPLSGPYHYGAHMMILYWDLIEESPVFTDEERLRVTNAFSKQFSHPQEQGWRRQIYESRAGDRVWSAGDRHGVWSYVSLYCLARYFQRGYSDPFWQKCIDAVKAYFVPLHQPDRVNAAYEHLYWYNTGIAPALSYMLFAGDRGPVENGVLAILLRGQEILISGPEPDKVLVSASIGFLHKAAYLMQDGRYLEYLRRTGIDLDVFRLGQSFWPEAHLKPELPVDLVGKWTIQPMLKPMWQERSSGLPIEGSFLVGSFRSAPDASGDLILIKGWNGAGRHPYHTFAVLELRLDGQTVLEGFLNRVLTRADGMVGPQVAMDAALWHRNVVGQTAVAVGETPKAPFSTWRRTLAQRVGRYALIVDNLAFRADSENMEVEIQWQGNGTWEAMQDGGSVRIEGMERPLGIHMSDPLKTTVEGEVGGMVFMSGSPTRKKVLGKARMVWRDSVRDGEQKIFFSLIASGKGASDVSPGCVRLGDTAAALALPEPAVAVVGEYGGLQGELVVLAQDHLHGVGMKGAALDAPLFTADVPVHVDWDFQRGILEVVSDRDAEICLALGVVSELRIDGEVLRLEGRADGLTSFRIAAGRHIVSGAGPDPEALEKVRGRLNGLLNQGRNERNRLVEIAGHFPRPDVPTLPAVFTTSVGGEVVNLVTILTDGGMRICVAEGEVVHVLTKDGAEVRTLWTDGPIRVLRWWEEHNLLLAGCADEKVIAFDPSTGDRKWVFVSEMDPDVFRAAKTYWFKSAPGHGGIHGLHAGVFLDGKSQAFVGSACTLEIIDENGELVKRVAVFWGPGAVFELIDGPEGSINLLVGRRPADTHSLAVINNRTLDPKPRSFHGVPPGHTYVDAWGCASRNHIFYEDLDGDGQKEVISEIVGTWNHITVWASDGTPLYNVNFGPAKQEVPVLVPPPENVRDLDVADLDGDGKKEILAATSNGMVIALDYQCNKIWARRLPSPPTVLTCVDVEGAPRIVAGCEDGMVVVLDGEGEIVRMDGVTGRPTCIERLNGGVVLATEEGEVKGWKVER